MNNLIATPFTPVFIRNKHLAQDSRPKGAQRGFIVAIQACLNEAPKLMVLTEAGAMFCYVPPHAICFDPDAPENTDVCPWDCLSNEGEAVVLPFIKHWTAEFRSSGGDMHTGTYLFSLNFGTQDWASIPEQYKIFHFIQGDDNNLHITVNNRSKWICGAFDQDFEFIPEPNTKRWFCEP
jgi:hypothetical protein